MKIFLILLLFPLAVLARAWDIQIAPFSIIRGQAVQFNVYHEADTYCRLKLYYTWGTDDLFVRDNGQPFERTILLRPNDPSRSRKFILTSHIGFRDFVGRRLRIQVHAFEFDPIELQFSPPVILPLTDCGALRFSIEVYDEKTGETKYYAWDRVEAGKLRQ